MPTRVAVVILGGGRAKRLRPLSLQLPKPLVTVGNVTLLETYGHLLRRAGIDRATVVLPGWFEEALDPTGLAKRTSVTFTPRWSRPEIQGSIGSATLGAAGDAES